MNKNLLTKLKKNKKGFTLIELVVVIAILGILAALAIPRLGGFTDQAKQATDKAASATIANAAKMYAAANNITTDLTDQPLSVLEGKDLIETGITFQSKEYASTNAEIKWSYTASTGAVVVKGKDGKVVPIK